MLTADQAIQLKGGFLSLVVNEYFRGRITLTCVSTFQESNAVQFAGFINGQNPETSRRSYVRWGRGTYGLNGNVFSYEIRLPATNAPSQASIFVPNDARRQRRIFFLGTLPCEPLSPSLPPPDALDLEFRPACVARGSICVSDSLIAELLEGRWFLFLEPPPTYIIALGNITPLDSDHDGIPDFRDACSNTASGAVVNADGCSIDQLCPCDGPWRNHGEFVNCTKRVTAEFVRNGLISPQRRSELVRQAARSDCGKR